jgi:hypothetical protein
MGRYDQFVFLENFPFTQTFWTIHIFCKNTIYFQLLIALFFLPELMEKIANK